MQKLEPFQYATKIQFDDYITRDHRVEEIRILPGVTFLDMIARILENENISLKNVRFENILFKEAISVTEDYDCNVEVSSGILDEKENKYQVTVKSTHVRGNKQIGQDIFHNYSGKLAEDECEEPEILQVKELLDKASIFMDMDEVYANLRKLNIHHYEFMKAKGKIYKGNGFLLAKLSLGELAKQYENEFFIHPCLLDASTIVALCMHHENYMQSRPYIPIYLKSFKAYRKLAGDCYVYVPLQDENSLKPRDVYYSDFKLYNESGEIIAEFTKLAAKKVRSKNSLVKNKNAVEINTARIFGENDESDELVTVKNIQMDLKNIIAGILQKNIDEIGTQTGFYDLGLESTDLLNIVEILDEKVKCELYPILLFEYANIKELSEYLYHNYCETYVISGKNRTDNFGKEETQENILLDEVEKNITEKIVDLISDMIDIQVYTSDWDKGFYELGMDSSNLIDLVNQIEEQLNIELYPTLLFEYPTIRNLAAYLLENFPQQCSIKQVNQQNMEAKEKLLKQNEPEPTDKFVYMTEKWVEQPAGDVQSENIKTEVVLYSGWNNVNKLRDALPDAYFIDISDTGNDWDVLFQKIGKLPNNILFLSSDGEGGKKLFLLIRYYMSHTKGKNIRLLYFWKETEDVLQNACCEAVNGLLKTVSEENPMYEYKAVKIVDNDELTERIQNEWASWKENYTEISYIGGLRFVRIESKLRVNQNEKYVVKGTYLITGGLGGVGYLFAKYILQQKGTNVILMGKSELADEKKERFERLKQISDGVIYYVCDITNRENLQRIILKGKEHFGKINGVFHAAGIIKDGLVIAKEQKDFVDVVRTKMEGAINLDDILAEEPLDFFAVFSSTAARIGNIGQSDYTYANAFLDSFAWYREQSRKKGKRYGKTVSIGWSYWKNGGMKINETGIREMKEKSGFVPIDGLEGVKAFFTALTFSIPHVLVMKGNPKLIYENFGLHNAGEQEKPEVMSRNHPLLKEDDVAIIGMSGNYPMASNLEEFWDNLKEGRDCITEIPTERWNLQDTFNPDKESFGTSYSKWGGFLSDIDKFDALFFHISPREAQLLDPQERLFLETVWKTMEDSGYTKNVLQKEKVGVFTGAMWTHYDLFKAEQDGKSLSPMVTHASIANRISYFFNFKGPSIALDTMCSSSLTALHLACQSIKSGECSYAVAGGVNLSLHPNKYVSLSHQKFISKDGRCRSFGEGGDGYVPGEGAGAFLLKKYSQAVKDHDNIYGIIKATTINSCGTTSGYTVPSPVIQEQLIVDNIQKSGIPAEHITAIEAHGTGTALGDPIEIEGLKRAFSKYTEKEKFCSIGSVKSNIGHLEAAAGAASIAKVLLEMKYKKLVPSIHSNIVNKKINLEHTAFYLQHKLEDWNVKGMKRCAAISSFGAGGANAHVILEEYTREKQFQEEDNKKRIFLLSAKNKESLKQTIEKFILFLQKGTSDTLKDIVYTLQVGREEMEERFAVIVSTKEELLEKLSLYLDEKLDEESCFYGNIRKTKEGQEETAYYEEPAGYAKKWVMGQHIDFECLYSGEEKPFRISIPGYSFQRKRYWVDDFVKKNVLQCNQETNEVKFDRKQRSKVYQGDEVVLQILDQHIALVRLQDTKGTNTFTDEFINGLMARFEQIRQNKEIKCVIITGYDNIFSMGGTQQQLTSIAERKSSFTDTPFLYRGLLECEIPVIAAIQGHATGGGFLFGLYADIVVLAEESIYTAVFTKYGFTPGMGATLILEERLGKAVATEMMFTAKPFSGKELKERGIEVQVVKRDDVLNRAIMIAQGIADKPAVTIKTLKHELSGRILSRLYQCIEREEWMHEQTFTQPEVKERIEHFYINQEENKKAEDVKVHMSEIQETKLPAETLDEETRQNIYRKLVNYIQEEKVSVEEAVKLKNSILGEK